MTFEQGLVLSMILEYSIQIIGCQEQAMPRPRIFDEDAALAAATAEFWQRGYAGTSVRDLGASMGLGAASFYNAFGDKRALFLRCMDRYLDDGVRARIRRLEQGRPPREAIEEFIIEILALSRRDRRGCL
ncbi:MAG: TetR/AcrR family transcriptional regulator, partial [Alphaproteobacteria bacterium]